MSSLNGPLMLIELQKSAAELNNEHAHKLSFFGWSLNSVYLFFTLLKVAAMFGKAFYEVNEKELSRSVEDTFI